MRWQARWRQRWGREPENAHPQVRTRPMMLRSHCRSAQTCGCRPWPVVPADPRHCRARPAIRGCRTGAEMLGKCRGHPRNLQGGVHGSRPAVLQPAFLPEHADAAWRAGVLDPRRIQGLKPESRPPEGADHLLVIRAGRYTGRSIGTGRRILSASCGSRWRTTGRLPRSCGRCWPRKSARLHPRIAADLPRRAAPVLPRNLGWLDRLL